MKERLTVEAETVASIHVFCAGQCSEPSCLSALRLYEAGAVTIAVLQVSTLGH